MSAEEVSRLWDATDEIRRDVKLILTHLGEMSGDIKAHTVKLDSGEKKFDQCETRIASIETSMVDKIECEQKHANKWRWIPTVIMVLSMAAAWTAIFVR